ncbi:MAG: hypothetical protein MUE84_15345 [Hyphomonas sp.]|nr:hypothetical protein [Hyphomonas sp.]
MGGGGRHLAQPRNDDDPEKSFPASIASLVGALRQNWAALSGDAEPGAAMTVQEFRKNPPATLLRAIEKVDGRLQGLKLRQMKEPAWSIAKLEYGSSPHLAYWHLRVLSDWVGLSVAQLLMFTHFVSVERRAENRGADRYAELKRVHAQYQRVLDEVGEIITAAESDADMAMYEVIDGEKHEYHPKEDLLLSLAKAADRTKV